MVTNIPISRSSNVINLSYDSDTFTLSCTYSRGNVYEYYNVPEAVFLQVAGAPSVGKAMKQLVEKRFSYSAV